VLSGTVQADETWIGGQPKNRHRNDPREPRRAYATTDKQPILSLVHYETRAVRSRVVADVTAASLLPAMQEVADLPSVWLQTDAAKAYTTIARHVADHQAVSHESGQYVGPGGVGTNLVENFFSQLKRSIDGTHHAVSRQHLHRYLAQFDFLFTHCRRTDSERMRLLLGNVAGRRLTYKPLANG
jgi:ISXO2 transposase-like protein